MTIIKSFYVGNGDMFYIRHASDSFTILDCNIKNENAGRIISELEMQSKDKSIVRFICTHPDQDHFGGIEILDDRIPLRNFYSVKNQAIKSDETESFKRYCQLRDDPKRAYYLRKGCKRKWLNEEDGVRGSAGISVLWPDPCNVHFKNALADCESGVSYNNTSTVVRYSLKGGASVIWLGDLETDFMEKITEDIELEQTTIVIASHHGRKSGKIPTSWMKKLDPQLIVVGSAPSEHLDYYRGYDTITQNSAGDVTMELVGEWVHLYVSKRSYCPTFELSDEGRTSFDCYIGSFSVVRLNAEEILRSIRRFG